ncbi:Uncharacterised protein [Vibrio cholerae]|nr:Uncharacterised protein [Vibrio cholerae]
MLVKVTAITENGEASSTDISHAIRCTSTRVLPLPAPAKISKFSSGAATASRCLSLRPSSNREGSIMTSPLVIYT